ncbi:MAG: NAD-dependent epimerase/dehydratase family protein [Verrucomicrobiae bacterium]|nr:NAD-dependent epimerase/dehydratase family protein [Verrucomicrobiae bacterium]
MNPISPYWKDRKVVVTGAAGLVGSHLCDLLVEGGADVLAVDDLSKGVFERLAHLEGRLRFARADLCVPGAAEQLFQGQQVILHLASRAYGIAYSVGHHEEMLRFNVDLNRKVLAACAAARVERVLAVSSSCVYPDDAPCPTPELPVNTGEPEKANRGYGQAKRELEIEATRLARDTGIGVAIVRPCNAYSGRYKWEGEYSHVIPMLVKRVMEGEEPLVVWGTGRQRRNFLHAVDFSRCFLAVTEHHAKADPVNVGYEETVTMEELARAIGEAAGRKLTIRFDPSKPEGRLVKSADSTKLRRVTGGITPTIPLGEGIREMIEWYSRTFPAQA